MRQNRNSINYNMPIIGITGSIGCGKSSVSAMLRERGYCVIDADKTAHKIYEDMDDELINELKCAFSDKIFNGRVVDRGALGAIVFKDKSRLEELNKIVHPHINRKIEEAIEACRGESGEVCFIDAALIIENIESFPYIDKLVVVYCDDAVRIDRVIKRDSLDREEVIRRINAQLSQEEKKKKADYIIDNSGSIEELGLEVEEFIKYMRVNWIVHK